MNDPHSINDLDLQLQESIKKVELFSSSSITYTLEARQIIANVIMALGKEDNPFKLFPWDTARNIFSEIIDFALKYTPELLRYFKIKYSEMF